MKFYLLLLFSCCSLATQATSSQVIKQKIQSYLSALEQKRFSGSVLIEYQGQILLAEGYGASDRKNKRRNTPATVFDVGSVTKQFTSAAILKLEMQCKL